MRLSFLILVTILFNQTIGWAQTSVALDQWPARLQLYPRNQASQCTVAIAGSAPVGDVRAVSLVVIRDKTPYKYFRTATDSLTGRFAFAPVIKAELSQYSFQVFAHTATPGDSVQVAFRDSIVCGDVFLIMGQSNAIGRFNENPFRSTFCRTFGVNNGDINYNPADTAWSLTNTTEGLNCLWGVELQRLIKEQQGIPTAVINGAVGSTNITSHATRDGNQPASLRNLYGRLLYRTIKAGVARQVKAMIWRQGEAEAANDPDVYVRVFPQLYSYWKQDYPGLKKVYHSQINILTNDVIKAGIIRDYQRRSKTLFTDNEPIATIGLPGYQGLHYYEAGYRQFGLELYRMVARDFYGSTDTSNIQSPNIQKLYYSKPEKDEITLEFEPGQKMSWPADTLINTNGFRYTQSLSNFLYTDYPSGESGLVKSVTEDGNRLIIKLTKSINAKHLTYLPSSYQDNQVGFYVGPYIRNKTGMRALSFYQVPIAPPLPTAAGLRAVPIDTSAIKLSWENKSDSVARWSIERADTSGKFRQLAVLPGSSQVFEDIRNANRSDSLKVGKIYEYRVRSIGPLAVSEYSPVVTASLQLVLSVKVGPELNPASPGSEPGLGSLVFPNPASDQVYVRLPLDWSGDIVKLTLTDQAGTVVFQRNNQVSSGTSYLVFSVAAIPTGIYVLAMQYRTGGLRCRLVVTH